MVLHGGRSVLKRAMETISGAFKALAEIEKLRWNFRFSLTINTYDRYGQVEQYERLIGGLEKLETVARDEDSRFEYDGSDIEKDEE